MNFLMRKLNYQMPAVLPTTQMAAVWMKWMTASFTTSRSALNRIPMVSVFHVSSSRWNIRCCCLSVLCIFHTRPVDKFDFVRLHASSCLDCCPCPAVTFSKGIESSQTDYSSAKASLMKLSDSEVFCGALVVSF